MFFSTLFLVAALWACGGGIKGQWSGSGEIFDGKFFDFTVNFKDEKSGAVNLAFKGLPGSNYQLCGMKYKDMAIEFIIEGSGLSSDCGSLKEPLTFYGTLGAKIISGDVLNVKNQRIGVWRAFRAVK
ncbi:MAG: hypothetical protein FJ088_09975 [Deltaproteobacteria bacterium]|nr:hypothetical protein [Deltaproteobacteria bacterium]